MVSLGCADTCIVSIAPWSVYRWTFILIFIKIKWKVLFFKHKKLWNEISIILSFCFYCTGSTTGMGTATTTATATAMGGGIHGSPDRVL